MSVNRKKSYKHLILKVFISLVFLFVILFSVYKIADISSEGRWEDFLSDLKKKGFRISPEGIYPERPEDQNAAPMWDKALDKFKTTRKASEPYYKYIKGSSITDREKKILKQNLKENEEVIQLIKKASRLPCNHIVPDYSNPMYSWEYPRLTGFSRLFRFSIYTRGKLLFEQGNQEEALNVLLTAIYTVKNRAKMGKFLDFISGCTLMNISYKLCMEIMPGSNIPEPRLMEMIHLLDPEYFRSQFVNTIDYNRIFWIDQTKQLYHKFEYTKTSSKFIKLSDEAGIPLSSEPEKIILGSAISDMKVQLYFLWRPQVYKDSIFIQEKYIEMIDAAKKPYYKAKDIFLDIDKDASALSGFHFYPYCALSSVQSFHVKITRTLVQVHILRFAMACRVYQIRHKDFPSSLEDISPDILEKIPLDPFCGKPFYYKNFPGKGFVIYSVGENEKADCPPSSLIEDFRDALKSGAFGDDIIWVEEKNIPKEKN